MKKFLRSKALAAAVLLLVILLFLGGVFAGGFFSRPYDTTEYIALNMFLDGEYAIDDGEWKPLDPEQPVRENFQTIVFRGKLNKAAACHDGLQIFSRNVWYTLAAEDGTIVSSFQPKTLEEAYDVYAGKVSEEYQMPELWFSVMQRFKPLQYRLLQSPGYRYAWLRTDTMQADALYTLEVINPYPVFNNSFSDCFSVNAGNVNSEIAAIFNDAFWKIAMLGLICFFGMFLFPAAGFLSGKVQYSYLSYGILCFFWGIYMALEVLGAYLNLWIVDTVLCMTLSMLSAYCFITVLLLYFRSNMTRPFTRSVSGAMAVLYLAGVIAALVLHLTGGWDLVRTMPYLAMLGGLCLLDTAAMLLIESRQFRNRKVLDFLISWTPLALSMVIDIGFSVLLNRNAQCFLYGFAVTMLLQLIRLVLDIRKQYREAIEYQKVQKELYEAKVAVMVSQIRPHFMYNALSSIAMLCKLDPDRAYTATVTFSDYLRGNMDSLKQTAPVPFSKELEHLKKYLYIEKMRFDDMLNIRYDIQTEAFSVPQLSVQPLVENAVKHGVGMKEDGGTVTIATRETETAYEILISDDGVGFDTSAPPKEDGRSHVGMENTRKRLKEMCNAEIVITSTPGEGTTAKVIIPKEETKS